MRHDDDPLLKPSEVAERLRVRVPTVARWVKAGKLPAVHLPSGHRRFRLSVVEAFTNPDSDGGAP